MAKKFAHKLFLEDLKKMVKSDSNDPMVLLSPYIQQFEDRAKAISDSARGPLPLGMGAITYKNTLGYCV